MDRRTAREKENFHLVCVCVCVGESVRESYHPTEDHVRVCVGACKREEGGVDVAAYANAGAK